MSIYILSGFSAPLLTRATFLIPYFSLVGTNEVFAQELDGAFDIADFCPLNTDHFESIPFFPNPIPRQKGQAAVLGVRLAGGAIIYGGVQHIRQQLSRARKLERVPVSTPSRFLSLRFLMSK